MDYYGANSVLPRLQGPTIDPRYDWNSQHAAGETGLEEAMWQMTLQAQDAMERGSGRVPYPERPGEADCVYYMRTGVCSFGTSCRFNHPPNRSLYYLKTGTCKFGTTCKYHHPRYKPGPVDRMLLNVFGYPLRPGTPPCSFYAQHGICKFGPTCKFDHPMGTLSYSPSASSLADMPVAPYPVGSSLATLAPSSSSSELRSEGPAGPSKENISTAEAGEALEVATQGTVSSSSVGSTFKQGGQTSLVQKSNQISVPSTGSASQSDIPSSS